MFVGLVMLLAGCGTSQVCSRGHAQAVREAKAQTANFFAPLPAASQTHRDGFYQASLKVALAKFDEAHQDCQ